MKTTLASLFALTALVAAGCGAPEDQLGREEQGIAIAGLFPTGVNASGVKQLPTAGEIHYALTVNPDTTNKTIQVTNRNAGWYTVPVLTNAAWISNVTDSTQNTSSFGTYTFETTFTLTDVSAATAQITGTWACDNSCVIQINGHSVTNPSPAYAGTSTFSVPVGSGFVVGLNKLDFIVTNDGTTPNPMGLLITAISGTASCTSDTDCAAGSWCNNLTAGANVCQVQTANGTAVPGGSCTATMSPPAGTIGARACASNACDPADSKCGIATGDSSCTPSNAATVCRSTFCSTNSTCKATATSCNADGDCTPSQFCNTSTNACVAKGNTGAAIPVSGTCGAGNTSNRCLSGVCGTNNVCGDLNGTGPCTTANASGTSGTCQSGVCDPAGGGGTGLCHQCTTASAAACTGTTPICDTSTFTCSACNGDNGTTATSTCGAAAPYCPGGSAACTTCGTAGGTTTCTAAGAAHAGGICESTGACGSACSQDTSCAPQQFCNTMTTSCVADLANGTPIPTIASHAPPLAGMCTTTVGNAVCATHVCDTVDNKCGYADGDGTCAVGAATVCRSGACSINGACEPFGGCNVDQDCVGTSYCSAGACVAKAATGSAIPNSGTCTAGASNRCLSGTCAADNICGEPNGSGPCTSANASGTSGMCRSGVCDPAMNAGAGSCVQCTTASSAACTGATPICDTTTDTCGACTGDNGSGATSACPTSAPYCPGAGGACTVCGTAGATTTCTAAGATHAGTICQSSGACSNVCQMDSSCVTSQFCDTGATPAAKCVADIANGFAVPNIPSHTSPTLSGMCTVAAAMAACQSQVCDTVDDKCGYADGDGACTTTSAATVCRGGACSANGKCISTGGCNVDIDCAPGTQYCDTTAHTCQARVATGTAIPTGATCVAGASDRCLSGTCDADNICGHADGVGPCTAANASGTAGMCRSNVCDAAANGGLGLCRECTSTNATNCTTAAPICDSTSKTCVTCDGDHGTTASATCPTANPYCPGGGMACTTCGTVGGTTTCAAAGATHAGNVCLASGACSVACVTDANCTVGTQFCDTGATPSATCVADLANGTPIPSIPTHMSPTLNGTCTAAAGTTICASHVCDTSDNACGFANGDGSCTPANAATVCRSGACSTNGVCVKSGGCNVDHDCTSAEWCDTSTSTCEPRVATGTTIPNGGTCASGVSSRCLSGSCDSDNVCGHAAGNGPCTVATEGGTSGDCRTQICDAASSVCAQCTSTDSTECPTGTTCTNDACTLGAPVITTPVDKSTLADGNTTIGGTGTPGSVVTVSIDGMVVGTANVDANGKWTLPMSISLSAGNHTISATATAGTGASATTSKAASITVTVEGAVMTGDMGTQPVGPTREGISGGGFGCSAAATHGGTPFGALLVVFALLAVGFVRRRDA